mmetsp:Transcript_3500/g.8660  ORF Transcript_3500/g.8660 Transcript_3500/m.8660 type:complete len:84 (+) Transcript_3500:160-411(+)
MHPRRFVALSDRWSVSCVTPSGPWDGPGNRTEFARLKKEAFVLHYCNSMLGEILPYPVCLAVRGPYPTGACRPAWLRYRHGKA